MGLAPVFVGVAGFEPTTSSSRTTRATKLRYTPCNIFKTRCSLPETSFSAIESGILNCAANLKFSLHNKVI
jgi:hypothetical protein